MLRKQLNSLRNDPEIQDYPVSGFNRAKAMKPPSDWDDIRVAAAYESDYRNKN